MQEATHIHHQNEMSDHSNSLRTKVLVNMLDLHLHEDRSHSRCMCAKTPPCEPEDHAPRGL